MVESGVVAIAGILRTARKAAGYTQEELAEKAKVSTRTIGNLERGVILQPRQSTLRYLAIALGLSQTESGRLDDPAGSQHMHTV